MPKRLKCCIPKCWFLELFETQMFHFVARLFLLLLPPNGDEYLTNKDELKDPILIILDLTFLDFFKPRKWNCTSGYRVLRVQTTFHLFNARTKWFFEKRTFRSHQCMPWGTPCSSFLACLFPLFQAITKLRKCMDCHTVSHTSSLRNLHRMWLMELPPHRQDNSF